MRVMRLLTTVCLMESLSANGRVVHREYAEHCYIIVVYQTQLRTVQCVCCISWLGRRPHSILKTLLNILQCVIFLLYVINDVKTHSCRQSRQSIQLIQKWPLPTKCVFNRLTVWCINKTFPHKFASPLRLKRKMNKLCTKTDAHDAFKHDSEFWPQQVCATRRCIICLSAEKKVKKTTEAIKHVAFGQLWRTWRCNPVEWKCNQFLSNMLQVLTTTKTTPRTIKTHQRPTYNHIINHKKRTKTGTKILL